MVDIVDSATRSRMMSGIRGRNTKPEVLIRSLLHRQGFRFRLDARDLPGRPDIVLPRYRAVVLVHGCFWHGHDCHLFKWPQTRPEFWREKIGRNRSNDDKVRAALLAGGWRVARRMGMRFAWRQSRYRRRAERLVEWLRSDRAELRGTRLKARRSRALRRANPKAAGDTLDRLTRSDSRRAAMTSARR